VNLNNIRDSVGISVHHYVYYSVPRSIQDSVQDTVYWSVLYPIEIPSVRSIWFSVRDSLSKYMKHTHESK
jgi:hypothetical protein